MRAVAAIAMLFLGACETPYEAPRGQPERETTCNGEVPGAAVEYLWHVEIEGSTTVVATVRTPTDVFTGPSSGNPVPGSNAGDGEWCRGGWCLKPTTGRDRLHVERQDPQDPKLRSPVGFVPCTEVTF